MQGKVTLKTLLGINTDTHPDTHLVPKTPTDKYHIDPKQLQKRTKKTRWSITYSPPQPPHSKTHPKAPTQEIPYEFVATKIPNKPLKNKRTQIKPNKTKRNKIMITYTLYTQKLVGKNPGKNQPHRQPNIKHPPYFHARHNNSRPSP